MTRRSWSALAAGIALGAVLGRASAQAPAAPSTAPTGTLRIDAGSTSARLHPGDGRWPRLPAGTWSVWWDGDPGRQALAWREGATDAPREIPLDAPLRVTVAAGERWHVVERDRGSDRDGDPRLTVLEAAE